MTKRVARYENPGKIKRGGGVTTLLDMACGDRAYVLHVSRLMGYERRRLLSMGVRPGVVLQLLRVAPLGDPLIVQVMDTQLVLHKKEASAIWVEVF